MNPDPVQRPRIVVTAAVVERDGHFLVARRQAGTHLEGLWEFPGGKCHAGETTQACLVREIREELGTGFVVGPEILTTTHEYPERVIELHFLRGTFTGEPRSVLGQEIRWIPREDLGSLEFPPADDLLVRRLLTGRP